jgi:hypothetical protein
MRSFLAVDAFPSTLIERLGGRKVVSDELELPLTTVSSWAARESIPVPKWPDLIDLAQRHGVEGISNDTLAEAHVKAKASSETRAA